jgi:tetratricopeptide (TPR) repeat protein
MKNINSEDRHTDKEIQQSEKISTSARTKPSLIEAAKQGNPKAIAKLMNRSLQPKGITVKVALDKNCLQVMLESSQLPTSSLVEVIRKGLLGLGVESIKQVKVYGKQIGEEIPDWSEEFELAIPTNLMKSIISPSATSANDKSFEIESQQQKVDQPKVNKWKTSIFIVIITGLLMVGFSYLLINLIITYETFKGRELSNLERYQEALNAYDKVLQANPNHLQAWSERSLVLRRLGRYDEALISAEKAIEINPNFADGWKNRCGALMTLQRNQEALNACDKAIQLKPDLSQAWYNRALVLKDLIRNKEAIASYDKVLQLHPDYYTVWYERGVTLQELQGHQEALASYDKALQLEPNYYEAWANRGIALIELERYEDALDSFEKSLQIENTPIGWYGRGKALHGLGRYQEAVECYDKAIRLYPDNPNSWYAQGLTLEKLGRYKEAIASYDKAIQIGSLFMAKEAKENLLKRLKK